MTQKDFTFNVEGYVGKDYPPDPFLSVESNYCYDLWEKFVALTDEEQENLKKIRERLRLNKVYKIFENEEQTRNNQTD